MCGRFSWIQTEKELLIHRFNLSEFPADLKPRYNIAPTNLVPVILNKTPKSLSMIQWGLIPSWAQDESIGSSMINARAESVLEKKSFAKPMKGQRCLVIADGFYEWRKEPQGKQPYRITLKSEELFTFAGLYDTWVNGKEKLTTCTIITTMPNKQIKEVHSRMPAILTKEQEPLWLSRDMNDEKAHKLLRPFPGELNIYPVSRLVNDPENDFPKVIEPVKPSKQATLEF